MQLLKHSGVAQITKVKLKKQLYGQLLALRSKVADLQAVPLFLHDELAQESISTL